MSYTFKKTDGGPISKTSADALITAYKAANPEGPWAFFFGEDIIQRVIDQEQAVGMRVYLGLNEEKKVTAMLVGTTEDGKDLWPSEKVSATTVTKASTSGDGDDDTGTEDPGDDTDGVVGDQNFPCPPYCP